jgi:5-methylcytosine-specific restriction endonuclease McrA
MSNHNMGCKNNRRRKHSLSKQHGDRCHYCGQYFAPDDLTLDHIIPRSRGGSNALTNLCLACSRCNHRKGSW